MTTFLVLCLVFRVSDLCGSHVSRLDIPASSTGHLVPDGGLIFCSMCKVG